MAGLELMGTGARSLGRLDVYNGNRNEWATWRFAFRTYVGANSPAMLQHMDEVETNGAAPPFAGLHVEQAEELAPQHQQGDQVS